MTAKSRARREGAGTRLRLRTVAADVWRTLFAERIAMLAAAIAFYTFLSLPPALTLFVSIYGLIAEPADVAATLDNLGPLLPAQAHEILSGQLGAIASSPSRSLTIGIAISLLIGLWSATRGIRALIVACNAIDGQGAPRGLFALNRLALTLTAALLVFGALALFLVVLLPASLALLAVPAAPEMLTAALRWPLLGVLMMAVLAVLYAYAPNRSRNNIHWGSWGAVAATVLWLVASVLMSQFVRESGRYNEIYGTLASVAVLLLWLYLSGWAILLGAALNAALRRERGSGPPGG